MGAPTHRRAGVGIAAAEGNGRLDFALCGYDVTDRNELNRQATTGISHRSQHIDTICPMRRPRAPTPRSPFACCLVSPLTTRCGLWAREWEPDCNRSTEASEQPQEKVPRNL